ncbi:MAG: hypothetical protein ABI584_08025 [Acidobacteriota bacterium]
MLMVRAALRADAPPDTTVQFGTVDNPLRRGQFETMRALAHYLDGTARDAVVAANKALGNSSSARNFASLGEFSRSATLFHERMDAYETHHRDVPGDIQRLERSAKRVSDTIRRNQAWAGASREWKDVVDALSRMKRVLAGLAVDVPPARRRLLDYDRDYAPFPEGRDQGYEQYQRKRVHGGTDDPDYRSKVPTPGTNTLPPP